MRVNDPFQELGMHGKPILRPWQWEWLPPSYACEAPAQSPWLKAL